MCVAMFVVLGVDSYAYISIYVFQLKLPFRHGAQANVLKGIVISKIKNRINKNYDITERVQRMIIVVVCYSTRSTIKTQPHLYLYKFSLYSRCLLSVLCVCMRLVTH